MPNVLVEKRDGILILTLNKPDKYNGFDVPFIKEFRQAFEKNCHGADVDAILITGAGKAFCSGADVGAMRESLKGNPAKLLEDLTEQLHPLIIDIRKLAKPVIAAINGPVAGGGLGLALACDLRIASTNASFRPAYTRLGIVPDGGFTVFFPRLVGWGAANRILHLDQTVRAEEAQHLNIVDDVVEPEKLMERAMEVAKKVGGYPMESFRRTKELLNASFLGDWEAQLERERRRLIEAGKMPAFVEGVNAFFEKRDPDFKKRGKERKNLMTEA